MQLSPVTQQKIHDLKDEGYSGRAIARTLGCAQSTVQETLRRPRPDFVPLTRPAVAAVLSGPIAPERAPLSIPVPPKATVARDDADVVTAVLYGDSHFPFHDQPSLDIVQHIVGGLQPDLIVHMGDILDCYHLSRFDKNPDRLHSLQDEINLARAHLAQMRLTSPSSRCVLLGANHDARIEKMLWNLEGPAKALLALTDFRKLMTLDGLLGLSEMGWEFIPEDKQTKTELLTKVILKHGTVVRKWSGASAQGEWIRYGRSGASGHVHRLGVFMHGKHGGGAHFWAETGCTCTLDPEYMLDPDWQQGCIVLTVEKSTGAFQVEPVYIRNGLAVFRGAAYRA